MSAEWSEVALLKQNAQMLIGSEDCAIFDHHFYLMYPVGG